MIFILNRKCLHFKNHFIIFFFLMQEIFVRKSLDRMGHVFSLFVEHKHVLLLLFFSLVFYADFVMKPGRTLRRH